MRGGGRRSPPLTRKSSGGDVPHFEQPPPRVNAGYNAVNRGVDGKFVSCNGSSNVQKMVAASNDQAPGSSDRDPTSMEEGGLLPTATSEGEKGANSSTLGGRQLPHPAGDVPNVKGMEAQIRRDVASSGPDSFLPSIPDSSPTSIAVGMEEDGLDLKETSGSSMRTQAVCEYANNKISCTGAGNDDQNTANFMDIGCEQPHASSPTHSPSPVVVEESIVDEEMMGPARNVAVQQRDSKHNSSNGAVFSAWSKPGVSPLPSLKDLPHLKPLDGAAQLDEDEVNSYISRFDGALVGRLFGRHIPFYHLNVELRRRWERFGTFKLMTLSNECFICFFENTIARDAVLMGGPWTIAGQVIGLDKWTPGFSPSTSHGFITPVWIRFPELPFYCWGMKNLASISSLLGEPLWVDDATLNLSKGSYARVCIKLDLSQPLLPFVSIIGREGTFQQQVEYEGLSAFCSKCGRVGHKPIHCNPTLAAGGRPVERKKSHHIMNKAKSVGRTPIFGFSATLDTSTSSSKGKNAATHHASCSKNSNPYTATKAPLDPQAEEDQGGAGPWKIVPSRRRGRRLKHHQRKDNTAVHAENSTPTHPVQKEMQVQDAEQPAIEVEQLPDSSEHGLEAETVPIPHTTSNVPLTIFTHKSAPFSSGSRGNCPSSRGKGNRGKQQVQQAPTRPPCETYYFSGDDKAKFKKRKPAIPPDGEVASSFRPP